MPEPKANSKPAVHRCRYAFPVRPSDVANYGSAHHDYPATDIFAPEGADFVAPTDGRVDFVSRTDRWHASTDDPATRGGLAVAIIGKDGIRYYGSHLREVAPNIKRGVGVKAGEKLGEVGRSGNARNVASHLHFGISRPTYPTDWRTRRGQVSPFDYLNAWRKGDDVTPEVPEHAQPRCKRATG
ncbi:MAG TPA: M23 family metallopeptidase [Actinomycetota bacterium]|nr:M23 family metallopeptidase [Actinomycetota bacterium]